MTVTISSLGNLCVSHLLKKTLPQQFFLYAELSEDFPVHKTPLCQQWSHALDARWETFRRRVFSFQDFRENAEILENPGKYGGLEAFAQLFFAMMPDRSFDLATLFSLSGKEQSNENQLFGILAHNVALQKKWLELSRQPCFDEVRALADFPSSTASVVQIRAWWESLGEEKRKQIRCKVLDKRVAALAYPLMLKPFPCNIRVNAIEKSFCDWVDDRVLSHPESQLRLLTAYGPPIAQSVRNRLIMTLAKIGRNEDSLDAVLEIEPITQEIRDQALHVAIFARQLSMARRILRLKGYEPLNQRTCEWMIGDIINSYSAYYWSPEQISMILECGPISDEYRCQEIGRTCALNLFSFAIVLLGKGAVLDRVRERAILAMSEVSKVNCRRGILFAAENNQEALLDILLAAWPLDPVDPWTRDHAFMLAFERGHIGIARRLLHLKNAGVMFLPDMRDWVSWQSCTFRREALHDLLLENPSVSQNILAYLEGSSV